MSPVAVKLDHFGYGSKVVVDQELRLLVLGGPPVSPSKIYVIAMDKLDETTTIEIEVPGKILAFFHLARSPNRSEPVLAMDLYNSSIPKELEETLLAFDSKTGRPVMASWDIYKNLEITGGTEGTRIGTDFLYLHQFETGQLTTGVAKRIFEIGTPLPPELRFDTNNPDVFPELFLNNSRFMAVANGKTNEAGKSLVYRILDKHTNEWTKLIVPGNASFNVRGFGRWLAGQVTDSLGPKEFRLSPGRQRYQGGRQSNSLQDLDAYLAQFSYYEPGTLFLYDVDSKRYYQWDNDNADSEILLVEDGEVYYRVDRSIFRAEIGEKALGKPELLIKDDDIPYVHWAFFGPELKAAP